MLTAIQKELLISVVYSISNQNIQLVNRSAKQMTSNELFEKDEAEALIQKLDSLVKKTDLFSIVESRSNPDYYRVVIYNVDDTFNQLVKCFKALLNEEYRLQLADKDDDEYVYNDEWSYDEVSLSFKYVLSIPIKTPVESELREILSSLDENLADLNADIACGFDIEKTLPDTCWVIEKTRDEKPKFIFDEFKGRLNKLGLTYQYSLDPDEVKIPITVENMMAIKLARARRFQKDIIESKISYFWLLRGLNRMDIKSGDASNRILIHLLNYSLPDSRYWELHQEVSSIESGHRTRPGFFPPADLSRSSEEEVLTYTYY